jgi:hypothetical protein
MVETIEFLRAVKKNKLRDYTIIMYIDYDNIAPIINNIASTSTNLTSKMMISLGSRILII